MIFQLKKFFRRVVLDDSIDFEIKSVPDPQCRSLVDVTFLIAWYSGTTARVNTKKIDEMIEALQEAKEFMNG